jgi:hypothetical protein
MAGEEVPYSGKRERPMLNIKSDGQFNAMMGKEFGYTPKKSRLGEMMAGQMIQHVSDAEFNSMFGLDGNEYV